MPANPDTERRADNDASIHDQVLWALQQAGVLDLVLYIMGSEYENQYHLHALEIICLMYREQVRVNSSVRLYKTGESVCPFLFVCMLNITSNFVPLFCADTKMAINF